MFTAAVEPVRAKEPNDDPDSSVLKHVTSLDNQITDHPSNGRRPPVIGPYSYIYGSGLPNNNNPPSNGVDFNEHPETVTRKPEPFSYHPQSRTPMMPTNKRPPEVPQKKYPTNKALMNGHSPLHHTNNELRDPHNRLQPRTDLDLQSHIRSYLSSKQPNNETPKKKPEKLNIKQSTPIILPSKIVPSKPKHFKTEVPRENKSAVPNGSGHSLTSIENTETLKGINGFSYGIGSKGQVSGFMLLLQTSYSS